MIKSLAQSQQDLKLTKDTNDKLNDRITALLEEQASANDKMFEGQAGEQRLSIPILDRSKVDLNRM
jgi:septal ring factor EnvC (AmiA/AmiB activator)